jgi:hypothetical protein
MRETIIHLLEELQESSADAAAHFSKIHFSVGEVIKLLSPPSEEINNPQILTFQTKEQFETFSKACKRQIELMHPKYNQEG